MVSTGKVIYNLLSSNTGLTQYVGTKIFPLVISENTELPAITYERTYSNLFNRDSFVSTSTFDISVLSDSYSESISVAEKVHEILNDYSGNNSNFNVKSIRNLNGNETFNDNIFIQRMTFEVITY